ncbi:MAG: CvpA family protein [Lachnospiraceae bacterium]|nr:CvpA family protein [Lachnospiraceae bacterium]
MTKFIFVLVIFLLFVWRMKKGFSNGIMKEIGNILSAVVSLVCVALLFFAVSSVMAKAMSTLTVCVIGLILLGIIFKICSLIFRPVLALGNISVIGGLNKILGAVMGAAEACALAYLLYRVLDYMGIYVL